MTTSWRSLVKVLDLPNGSSVVFADDQLVAWLHQLAAAPVGSEEEDAILTDAARYGRLPELSAQVGLLDGMHRQRHLMGQELQ